VRAGAADQESPGWVGEEKTMRVRVFRLASPVPAQKMLPSRQNPASPVMTCPTTTTSEERAPGASINRSTDQGVSDGPEKAWFPVAVPVQVPIREWCALSGDCCQAHGPTPPTYSSPSRIKSTSLSRFLMRLARFTSSGVGVRGGACRPDAPDCTQEIDQRPIPTL